MYKCGALSLHVCNSISSFLLHKETFCGKQISPESKLSGTQFRLIVSPKYTKFCVRTTLFKLMLISFNDFNANEFYFLLQEAAVYCTLN